MKLYDALHASNIEVAELETDSAVIVVGIDGGEQYEVSFKKGDMPPYAQFTVDTVEQVEELLKEHSYNKNGWIPRQEED